MTTFRERVNAHLPIVLQFLSTVSLVAIALSAICGSNSLRKLTEVKDATMSHRIHKHHIYRSR